MSIYFPAWPWNISDTDFVVGDPVFSCPTRSVPDKVMDVLNVGTWNVTMNLDSSAGFGFTKSFSFVASSGAVSYSREGFVTNDTAGVVVQLGTPLTSARSMFESNGRANSPENNGVGAADIARGVLAVDVVGSVTVSGSPDQSFVYTFTVNFTGSGGGVRARDAGSSVEEWQIIPGVSMSVEEFDIVTGDSIGFDSSDGCTFMGESYGTAATGFSCTITPATYLA